METTNRRTMLQKRILQHLKNDITKCFEKYRAIGEQENNQRIRQMLFRILKTEIIKSLNDSEKVDLLKNIAENVNDGQSFIEPKVINPVNALPVYPIFDPLNDLCPYVPVNVAGQSHSDYFSDSYTDQIFQSSNDNFDDFIIKSFANEVGLVSKSISQKYEEIKKRQSTSDAKDVAEHEKNRNASTTSDNVEDGEIEDDWSQVEKIFYKLSNIIHKNEDIVEEFEKIKADHGEDVYRQAILYIPVNKPGTSRETDPILFQLAMKVEKYETALDTLLSDKLLLLNQKNQYKISIFNALLFKGFDVLLKFLSYVQKKNITCDIFYIISRSENSNGVESTNSDDELSLDSGNEDSNQTESETFLMKNGILHCRQNLKNSSKETFSSLIQKLKSLNLLEPVLNEEIEKENTYIYDLANEYPKSQSNILQILREDETLILRSSFFVALATKNISKFYEFLKLLIVELKMNRKRICDLCQEPTKNGQSVSSLLLNNRGEANAVKKIQEFFEKYGSY